MHQLLDLPFWIFDMDGTLTKPQHDFTEAYRRIGIPLDQPLLESIEQLPHKEKAAAEQVLRDWELELAHQAVAAPDSLPLLEALKSKGARCAVLTRNLEDLAHITLEAAGLMQYFKNEPILGRDSAPAKPSPVPIHNILKVWNAQASQSVMVGDYIFDMLSGQAAGAHTLLKESTPISSWRPELQEQLSYDYKVTTFFELINP